MGVMLGLVLVAQVAVASRCDDQDIVFHGHVSNYNYGYSVDLPSGISACNVAPPAPQHGFGIDFVDPKGARIWLDGSFNSIEFRDLEDAAGAHLMWRRERAAGDVAFSTESAQLGTLAAIRLLMRYTSKDSGMPLLEELVLALREEGNILYTVGCSSRAEEAARVTPTFEAIVAGWHADPLWPDDKRRAKTNCDE